MSLIKLDTVWLRKKFKKKSLEKKILKLKWSLSLNGLKDLIAKAILRKEVGSITPLHLKLYSKVQQNSILPVHEQTHRKVEQKKEPRNK